jgi:hypothetical protein
MEGLGNHIKNFTYIIIEVSDIGSEFDNQVSQFILTKGFEFVRDSHHHRSSINGKMFCDKLYKKIA